MGGFQTLRGGMHAPPFACYQNSDGGDQKSI